MFCFGFSVKFYFQSSCQEDNRFLLALRSKTYIVKVNKHYTAF